MTKSQANFHSVNGKRRLLVVDDEVINREILGAILENEYEILFAQDGKEALDQIAQNKDTLSLVILDLIMPNLPGQEVLRSIKSNPEYQDIPVIVASGDQSQEIECLNAGASDFIQKPYPDPGVIQARVQRSIELFEDRQIIQSTERDPLTGLYNREFFYSYAEQYDTYHRDEAMDAIVLDINHFSIINERYGRAYADEILHRVGEKAREMVHSSGGIVCRKEADTFYVYCPHREDYKAILDNASMGLSGDKITGNRVRLRMGVYSNVDKKLDMERRFDRAKMAADTVRTSVTRNIGIYDDTLHKSELYSEQLIEDFDEAIAQGQFQVYFQPKFDIRPETPVLCGAEGLVRWQHPDLGMISPGVFIPLFEENGLVQRLDNYVWRETARQIRQWKDELGITVPVSVNVSRIDMYDPNILRILQGILNEYSLTTDDMHLEVTESAYAEDSEQIIQTVKQLRSIGFQVEMDDFGTGYSSLNMLSTLPIDTLKLDMKFIRTAFSQAKDTHMIEVIVEIAAHLSVPIIAEGVETEEQIRSLKEIGCDMVQGYYFSPPVPADSFASFLEERKQQDEDARDEKQALRRRGKDGATSSKKARIGGKWGVELSKQVRGFSLRTASLVFFLLAALLSVALILSDTAVNSGYLHMEKASERYIAAQQAATNLEIGSDYLTDNVRCFVVTGDIVYLENFYEEVEVTRRRDKAVEDLKNLQQEGNGSSYDYLAKALQLSNELINYEDQAMYLILSAGEYDWDQVPQTLLDFELSPENEALSAAQRRQKAVDLVFGQEYTAYKEQIKSNIAQCTQELIQASDEALTKATGRMNILLAIQTVLTIALILVILAIILFIAIWVRIPLDEMVEQMKTQETVSDLGAEELRYVARTFNDIFEENQKTHDRLSYGATHDALTGLYNRTAYEMMRKEVDMDHAALILIDVDRFKMVNDTYGHDVGDMILVQVAEIMRGSFRPSDLIFRIGGDEFVVIMLNANSTMRDLVKARIDQANVMMQQPADDLPAASLSVGVAFADRQNPQGDIFKDADTALYRVKEAGRCGCVIY